GLLVAVVPLQTVLVVDAASFLVSALSLGLISIGFNTEEKRPPTSLRRDIAEGLRYVLGHPVLRNISIMMALVNFVGNTTGAQIVLFAKRQFAASDPQVALLFAAGSVGTVALSLAAGLLRRRWTFSRVALGALMLSGATTVLLSLTHLFWVAVPLWAITQGLGILFNINTGSLRQAITPNHMLGRVISIAGVLAWSAIPVGALAGGFAIQQTGDVTFVFAVAGSLMFLIPLAFYLFSPLGHVERYIPKTGNKVNGKGSN